MFVPYSRKAFTCVGSVLLLAASAVALGGNTSDSQVLALAQEADTLYCSNQIPAAQKKYGEALQLARQGASPQLIAQISERYNRCSRISPAAADLNIKPAARKQDDTADAMHYLEQARHAYAGKKYSTAVTLYTQALDALPDAPATQDRKAFLLLSLSDAELAAANDYAAVGRYDEARVFLENALQHNPSSLAAKDALSKLEDSVRNNPAITPEHIGNVAEVDRLLALAYGYYGLGQFDKAYETFRNVLRIDEYNTAAQQGMEKISNARSRYYTAARNSARSRAMADVTAAWQEPIPPDELPIDNLGTDIGGDARLQESDLDKILTSVNIGKINLEDADINEAMEVIRAQVRLYAENSGDPVTLNINTNFGAPGSPLYKQVMGRRITIDLTNISLKDLLDVISSKTGTAYYPTASGLEITYSGRDAGPLETRTFRVPPSFFNETPADDEDTTDVFSTNAEKSVSIARVDPKRSLAAHGITFPPGSAVQYLPASWSLTVRNTPTNLQDIQTIVSSLDSPDRQIVLNVTMMEVNESTLKELGFDWLVDISLGSHTFGGGGTSQKSPSADGIMDQVPVLGTVTNSAPVVSAGLRSGGQVFQTDSIEKLIAAGSSTNFANTGASAQRAPAILAARGIWSVADVTVIMHGLNQKKGTDILGNPQLIVKPGAEQTIFSDMKVMFYPESYDQPQISQTQMPVALNNAGGANGNRVGRVNVPMVTPAFPNSFVKYGGDNENPGDGIGTALVVHDAELDEEKNIVRLSLTTYQNEFDGFVNYGTPVTPAVLDENGDVGQVIMTENKILKPIFTSKMANTSISITPGNVLVLGGVRKSRLVKFQDKIPILGDAPLVGRFFRSEGEERETKVFLIFAKVDVIDPTGRDPRTGERPGALTIK